MRYVRKNLQVKVSNQAITLFRGCSLPQAMASFFCEKATEDRATQGCDSSAVAGYTAQAGIGTYLNRFHPIYD